MSNQTKAQTRTRCMFCNQPVTITGTDLEAAMAVYVLLDTEAADEVHGYVHEVCFERFVKVGSVRGFATGQVAAP